MNFSSQTDTVQAATSDSTMQPIDARFALALLEVIRLLRQAGMAEPDLRALFFQHILGVFWYSTDCEDMEAMIGHALYRLSDLLNPEERAAINLHPDTMGFISLEGWRQEWESLHPEGIPQLGPAELESARLTLAGS